MADRPTQIVAAATCEACGNVLDARPGSAFLCGPNGASRLTLPPARFCNDPACRKARDEVAIERAIEAGIIVREHPPGYDDQEGQE